MLLSAQVCSAFGDIVKLLSASAWKNRENGQQQSSFVVIFEV